MKSRSWFALLVLLFAMPLACIDGGGSRGLGCGGNGTGLSCADGTAGRGLGCGGNGTGLSCAGGTAGRGLGCAADKGPGGVNVILKLPKGEVEWVSSIDVSFDHPMVELGAAAPTGRSAGLSRGGRAPITLEPHVSGRFNWIGTRTASFIPDRPLPSATRFHVTVPAGLRAVDGKSVGQDVSWDFTTPLPKVLRSFPEPGALETRLPGGRIYRRPPRGAGTPLVGPLGRATVVPPGVVIMLDFNQAVDPSMVQRAARLAPVGRETDTISLKGDRPGKEQAEALKQWPEVPVTHRVILRPSQPLPLDTAWELVLGGDLTGSEGPLPMGQPYRIPFRTYGPFAIRGVRAPGGPGSITLDLTNPVDTDSLAAHLRFDPPVTVRGAWQGPDPAGTGVSGNFKAGTTYTLTVTPGLKDMFGNTITTGPPLTFTTGDVGPTIRIAPHDAVLELGGKREIAVLLTNVQAARLEMKALGAESVVTYLRDQDMGPWEWPMTGGVSRTLTRRTPRNITDTLYVSTDDVLGKGNGGVMAIQVVSLDPPPAGMQRILPPGRGPDTTGAPPGATDTTPAPPPKGKGILGMAIMAGPPYVPPRDKMLIRVTDLGVTAKTSETGGLAWATSLSGGAPLADVAIEIRDNFGRVVANATTGADGLALTAGLPDDPESGKGPYRLFARRGGDFTYLNLGQDWALDSWNFGIAGERWNAARDLDGFIYGDRVLYRPGETVHLKTMLRRRSPGGLGGPSAGTPGRLGAAASGGLEVPPAGTTVRIEVSGPRGESVLSATAALSRFGTFERSLQLDRAARPGTYGVTVYADVPPQQRHWSVWGSFRVEEYRAPEFKVEVASGKPYYESGQALDAVVTASYLFGAPLAGGTVEWSLSRYPAYFAPEGYAGYSFNDPEISPEYESLAGKGTAKLDAQGRAVLNPKLDLEAIPVSMDYTVEAEVRDLTGQASAAQTEVTVHRGLAYPGVKVGRDLVRAGEKVPVSVVIVAPDGKPAERGSGAKVSLVRREWRTVRRLLVGGVIGAETAPVDSVFETRDLPAGPGPHALEFRPAGPGYYRVIAEAKDAAGTSQKSAADFYAWGSGEYAWGWEPGVKLDLVTDRKQYAPGDTARILVRSPFRNALALITVEREEVRSVSTRRLTGTAETIAIPIPREGAAPNLYVSVALVSGSDARAGADPRIRLPEFRLGYATLVIDYRSKVLTVAVTPARKEAGPGDSLSVAVRLTDAAGRPVVGEVSLAVVDEAVLRLLGTKTPDPAGHFYRPRGLGVTTSELRRLVRRALSEAGEKGGNAGGGGGEEAFRTLFATTAYWNPSLVTDATGRVTAGFRLPDNLTTFRVMAVALDAGDRFGSGEERIVVTKPLLVQAALPRFANRGDRFSVGAVVHNRTTGPLGVDVTSQVEGLAARGTGTARLEIPAGESRRADFDVEASVPGAARVSFLARSGALSDGIRISFPVVVPAAPRREATAGSVTEKVTEAVTVPKEALPESSSVEVTLAPTLIGGTRAAFDFLEHYPYLCLEQVASAEWAKLIEARLFHSEPLQVAAARAIDRLAPFQKEDGGFSLWPGWQSYSAPYPTAYAVLVLAEARRAGGAVDALVTPAVNYLNWQFDSAESDTLARLTRASEWALALWALSEAQAPAGPGFGAPGAPRGARSRAMAGVPPFATARLEFLMAVRARLTATARLYLALAWQGRPGGEAAQRVLLDEIDNRAEQVAGMAFITDRNLAGYDAAWYSPIRLTGLFLTASIRSGRRSPLEAGAARWLVEQRRDARWPSTQDNLMALLGLAAWRDAYESRPPQVKVDVNYGAQAAPPQQFTSLEQPPSTVQWPAGKPGSSAEVQVMREGTGALYYTAALRYLEPTIGRPPVETSLTLVRSYEVFDPEAKEEKLEAVRKIAAGDLVLVKLTLVVPEQADFLAIADPLPAGLEPVNLGFVTTAQEAARRYLESGVYRPGREGLPVEFDEQRDREVRAFADHVPPGVYEYRYLARAITPGRFAAPRARAELMYHPEVVALTDGPWIEITRSGRQGLR